MASISGDAVFGAIVAILLFAGGIVWVRRTERNAKVQAAKEQASQAARPILGLDLTRLLPRVDVVVAVPRSDDIFCATLPLTVGNTGGSPLRGAVLSVKGSPDVLGPEGFFEGSATVGMEDIRQKSRSLDKLLLRQFGMPVLHPGRGAMIGLAVICRPKSSSTVELQLRDKHGVSFTLGVAATMGDWILQLDLDADEHEGIRSIVRLRFEAIEEGVSAVASVDELVDRYRRLAGRDGGQRGEPGAERVAFLSCPTFGKRDEMTNRRWFHWEDSVKRQWYTLDPTDHTWTPKLIQPYLVERIGT